MFSTFCPVPGACAFVWHHHEKLIAPNTTVKQFVVCKFKLAHGGLKWYLVALRHPYPLALRQLNPLVPLPESAAAVCLVVNDMAHTRIAAVTLHNVATPIRRAVVKKYQFKVLTSLA